MEGGNFPRACLNCPKPAGPAWSPTMASRNTMPRSSPFPSPLPTSSRRRQKLRRIPSAWPIWFRANSWDALKPRQSRIEQSPISMSGRRNVRRSGGGRHHLRQNAEGSLRSCLRARQGFSRGLRRGRTPTAIHRHSALEKIIDEILATNPKQLEQYRAGKKTMLGFFVGQVMKPPKAKPTRKSSMSCCRKS